MCGSGWKGNVGSELCKLNSRKSVSLLNAGLSTAESDYTKVKEAAPRKQKSSDGVWLKSEPLSIFLFLFSLCLVQ